MNRALINAVVLSSAFALLAGCGGGASNKEANGNPPGNGGTVVRGGNYTLIDLGTIQQGVEPVGFTAQGAIAGNFFQQVGLTTKTGIFLATPNADLSGGSITDVTPAGFDTAAQYLRLAGVNRAGQAVGAISGDGSGTPGATSFQTGVWDLTKGKAATVTPLRLPANGFGGGPQPAPAVTDISDDGVVGLATLGFGPEETEASFYLGTLGQLNRPPLGDLGADFLPGGLHDLAARLTFPYQVIDGGIVVGDIQYGKAVVYAGERFEYHRAFRYKDGKFADLGVPDGFTDSRAYRINARGQIIGEAQKVDETDYLSRYSEGKAFVYQDGKFTMLGRVGDASGSEPLAINSAGTIVGAMYKGYHANLMVGAEYKKAFVWKDGVMTDLNSQIAANSGYDLIQAVDINDMGQIAAVGVLKSGEQHVVLLTPH